jgi:4-alpha-glucanotransferase
MGYFNPSIPYTSSELHERGLYFDEERMCEPYIREYFLKEMFDNLTDQVKKQFLDEYSPGKYKLKPDFDSQRKIEEYLTPGPDTSNEESSRMLFLKRGLFSLVSEIIFIRSSYGPTGYFPRNGVHATRSFQELEPQFRSIIHDIYIDYFYRRNENFWSQKALTKLPVIKNATDMLLCGEDLGMVPSCVPEIMNKLGILSLEIQRMPKNPAFEFGNTGTYPYLSVATPSSHDTSTIRGWWEENRDISQKFFNQILGNSGNAPIGCEPNIVEQIINQHLFSPSMWAVFPIQDLFGMSDQLRTPDANSERINLPSNPNHYWRYRMHVTMESLLKHKEWNQKIREMVETSGRLDVY